MKIIDKTPFQNEKGEIGLVERIRGTLKYGFSWYAELEAQKPIITQLDRALEKGFVLIRNFTLPGVEIIEPIILIGPPGVYIIHVTPLSGFYEAKGNEWNTVTNGRGVPSSKNPMRDVARLAKALQLYLERQGVHLPNPVEPVLMASSPAMHIDSMRPAVRVVMSDAVKQFCGSLLQSRPILATELIHDLTDRIVEPNPAGSAPQANPQVPVARPQAAPGSAPVQPPAPSRAQAIFQASEEAAPLNPNELGFAFDDVPAKADQHQAPGASPARPMPQARQNKQPRVLGMTVPQLLVLIAIFLCWICLMAAAIGYYLFFLNS